MQCRSRQRRVRRRADLGRFSYDAARRARQVHQLLHREHAPLFEDARADRRADQVDRSGKGIRLRNHRGVITGSLIRTCGGESTTN